MIKIIIDRHCIVKHTIAYILQIIYCYMHLKVLFENFAAKSNKMRNTEKFFCHLL